MFLVLLGVFVGSIAGPKYKIWVDLSEESIVRRDTHLMPPGVTQVSVPFSEIRKIESKVSYSGWWGDRVFLRLVTFDWRRIHIAQGIRGEPPDA